MALGNNSNHKHKKGVIQSPTNKVEITSFEGLMPDPETLRAYEELHPGVTKQWMELAASEIKTRQINEERISWTYKYCTIQGQWLGFITSIAVLAAGCYAIYLGHPKSGAAIITGSAATVITAHIFRNKNNSEVK